MSSKSRQHSSKRKDRKKRRRSARAEAAVDAAPAPSPATGSPSTSGPGPAARGGKSGAEMVPDEVIHVPKGRSRLQFFILIGLLVFLLIVFVAPGAIMNAVSGKREDPVILGWEHPSRGRIELHASEYQREVVAFTDVMRIFPLFGFLFGVTETYAEGDVLARLLVLDTLAEEAGILISDADLGDFLAQATQGNLDREGWIALTNRYGGVQVVEGNLRRMLRIQRYVDLLSHVASLPDPAAIEELWAEEHEELAFDYVELETSALIEDAAGDVPADEELSSWFEARPESERKALEAPAGFEVGFAVFRDRETTPAAGLLERYPEPEGADAEERAQQYYDRVHYSRFVRPDPEDGAAEGEDPDPTLSRFLPFDEVKERCLEEAPVYLALQLWLEDLRGRNLSGEEIDLGAETAELGLDFVRPEGPLGVEEIRGLEGFGGIFLAGTVQATQEGKLGAQVVVEGGGMVVLRVDGRIPAAMPPFEEIRDRVAEMWAEEHAGDLALERLEALQAGFSELVVEEEEPDETDESDDAENIGGLDEPEDSEEEVVRRSASAEEFLDAAQSLGLEVRHRPWLDKSGLATDDPDRDLDGHRFLATQRAYFDAQVGEVPEAGLDAQRKHAYLVRLVGRRPIDIARMTPSQYQQYELRTSFSSGAELRGWIHSDAFSDHYGVVFPRASAEPGEGEEPGDAGDAGE